MLQPANRLTLIDAMRPPAGFGFESAMAVTYTLDLRALLVAPAALAFSGRTSVAPEAGGETTEAGSGTSDAGSDTYQPIELIHALRAHASKLTVFSQAGETGLPPSRRAFAFLERTIVPVTAPGGGIVHPKVWVLRYEAADDRPDGRPPERRLRVLIASRNLTFDASWDTMVRLDETTGSGRVLLAPVGELFEALLQRSTDRVTANHRARVRSLSTALQEAAFALPPGVDDLQIHVLGLTGKPSPLPSGTGRSLIISPFVSHGFFTRVHPVRIDELVSSPQQLDRLKPDSLTKVEKVHAFDDGSASDLGSDGEDLSHSDPGRPLVGLHAKVFAFEDDGHARLFLGSANATGPAFNSNVEILVEMAGSIDALGIDRLCGGTDDEPGLRDLFYDYRPGAPDEPDGETSLDRWRHAVARLAVEGHVTATDGRSPTGRPSRCPSPPT